MRRLFEYDLYFPVGGSAPDVAGSLERTKQRLSDFFGGLTDFRHRSEGTWEFGGVTYQDEVVLLRMLKDDRIGARAFLAQLREQLALELNQKEILVIEREVNAFPGPE